MQIVFCTVIFVLNSVWDKEMELYPNNIVTSVSLGSFTFNLSSFLVDSTLWIA